MAKATKTTQSSKSTKSSKTPAKKAASTKSTAKAAPRKAAAPTRDIPQEITNRIIAALEQGTAPWVKPWRTVRSQIGSAVPSNFSTGRAYSGVNVVLLWIAGEERGYTSNRWLTFRQAKELGGHVRSGETGTMIVYYGTALRKDEGDEGKESAYRFLKGFTVFNEEQCEGLPQKSAEPVRETAPAHQRDVWADAFVAATGADVREGHGEAYYVPSKDFISMPAFHAFDGSDSFYGTEFHELAHWTGAKSRLDRDLSKRFGSEGYAVEELVAELTASFLSAEFGFDGMLRSASYIQTWLKVLRQDKTAITRAAAAASKAHAYLRELALVEPAAAVDEIEAEPLRMAA